MFKWEATRYICSPVYCYCDVQYGSIYMDVFPLCGVGMMVANTYEMKPLDLIPRFTFEQMYGMHIGWGKPARIHIHRLEDCTRVDVFLNVDCIIT